MKYEGKIDVECIKLCDAMNELSGIKTIESCCGHNKQPYRIWFVADSLSVLPNLLYYFDGCHCGFYSWRIRVTTDCAKSPVHFCAEGPMGEIAYKQAEYIAELLKTNLK